MRFLALLSVLIIGLGSITGIHAQEADGAAERDPPEVDEENGDATEPAPWAANLRRAEIVATGSFPLTLLASRLTYSLIRFTVKSIQAGAIDTNYAPWFLAPPGSPDLIFAEKLGIVSGALGLSTVIAIVDYRRGKDEIGDGPQ